jgi:hypothetical protein
VPSGESRLGQAQGGLRVLAAVGRRGEKASQRLGHWCHPCDLSGRLGITSVAAVRTPSGPQRVLGSAAEHLGGRAQQASVVLVLRLVQREQPVAVVWNVEVCTPSARRLCS